MEQLTLPQCLDRIARRQPFHAAVAGGAFTVRIAHYAHFACTAIHAGHRLRPALAQYCAWSETERRYEEDPFTDTVIADQPITVVAGDSRFEYDLNRAPEACFYDTAWGRPVWRQPPPEAERQRSLAKHAAFYRFLEALYGTLEAIHPAVLIYDVHAFNYRRPGMGETPVFNVGTEQLDVARWSRAIEYWRDLLADIRLPGVPVRAAINEVFYGRGYHATFVTTRFRRSLILPTELKKVYMDEDSGRPIPAVLQALREGLAAAIAEHARAFREIYPRG